MSNTEQEARILETIVPNLQAQGYVVILHPSTQMLPSFMKGYVPDAIALGRPKNLAIEVVVERARATGRIEKIQELFRGSESWELRVHYLLSKEANDEVKVVSITVIVHSIQQIEELVGGGQIQPALLMMWATLEALGRALLREKFIRPQSPKRLVEVLASNGNLTPSEADVLRGLIDLRNRLIHGDLDVLINRDTVMQGLIILKSLVNQIKESS